MINFNQLQQIIGGAPVRVKKNLPVTYLAVDSRKIFISPETLFFAIRGTIHDGHQYIPELYKKGIRQFVVERRDLPYDIPEASVIMVRNSIEALQMLATYHREKYTLPVMAITGSNGKTIVKEWLSQLLSSRFYAVKSPKSYNSQIGVPLSVWQINAAHEIGVFEAGISQPGEMEKLQEIIKPDWGLFTNIGSAHEEGFKSTIEKIKEKARLFKDCQTVFYCKDYEHIENILKASVNNDCRLVSWSMHENADIQVITEIKDHDKTVAHLTYANESIRLFIPFTDKASIENCIHCIAVLLHQGFGLDEIQKGIDMLENISMRLELKRGLNDCYLIDDSYNNDLAGLMIALDFLNQQNQYDKKTVILSDMLEAGIETKKLYYDIANLLKNKQIDRFIGIGPDIFRHRSLFQDITCQFFEDTRTFLNGLHRDDFHREVILIKGARVFGFEKIVKKLQQKIHGTRLEIDLDALTHNLNFYRSKLGAETKMMVMVKAFAYGSGSFEVANLLQFHGVDYLAVAYVDEGIVLRDKGIRLPIMVMNPSPDSFDKLLEYALEPEIYSISLLKELTVFLGYAQKMKVHIKFDTGMHRLGFEEKDIPLLIEILKKYNNIEIKSVFSHLAGADEDIHDTFSHEQVKKLNLYTEKIEKALLIDPLKHVLNSPGIIRFPAYHFDMVRLGIGLYGIEANKWGQEALMPVGALKTTISQIKHIKAGETVGYGRKGKASEDLKLATIAIGYADGLSRRFGKGKGKVLVNAKAAPVIGEVCMDMTMIDITGIDAEEGDEALIFGKELSIIQLAEAIGTIPYEILTSVSERVKRVYFVE